MTQREFLNAVTTATRPVPTGLTDAAGRPAGCRFDVYRNNVAVSLRDALETGFPACRQLVGADNFARLAARYLTQEPPSSPILMLYGQGFARFLEDQTDLAHMGYLPDVARLELALRQSYHAADSTALDAVLLANLSENALNDAHLTLAPCVRLVESCWPVLQIHRRALSPDSPRPEARAESVLITRPQLDPRAICLPPGGAAFVGALLRDLPLGAAVEAAIKAAGPQFDPTATLTLLMSQSALTDLTTP